MKKTVLFLLCMVFLSACSMEEKTTSSKNQLCGYGPMMVVNGKSYLRLSVKKSLTLEKKLGEIKEKIDEKIHPVDNFSSNTLETGATIYSVAGHKDYLIAETKGNEYLLFEEIK